MTPIVLVPAVEKDPEILTLADKARALTIATPEQASYVDEFCVWLKQKEKETIARHADGKKKAHEAWKAWVAMESMDLDKITEAYKIAKGALIAWADAERVRAEQEAAIARAKAKQAAEDEALARAARAEEFGDGATADAIINAPVVVEPVKVAAPVKTATVMQTRWRAKVVNPALVPDEYWVIDEQKIGAVARGTKGAINIPGVEIWSERC